jgi:hypothetical protein
MHSWVEDPARSARDASVRGSCDSSVLASHASSFGTHESSVFGSRDSSLFDSRESTVFGSHESSMRGAQASASMRGSRSLFQSLLSSERGSKSLFSSMRGRSAPGILYVHYNANEAACFYIQDALDGISVIVLCCPLLITLTLVLAGFRSESYTPAADPTSSLRLLAISSTGALLPVRIQSASAPDIL